MARTHKDPDGVSKVIDLFPAGSQKAVERLLKRARECEAREAGRSVKAAGWALKLPSDGLARLTRELGRALTQRGAKAGRASVRQVSPQSGGRPFHFAHSVVSKSEAPAPAGTKARKAGAAGSPGGGIAGKGGGRAAAHMRYIEREMAVEALYGQGEEREGLGRDGRTVGSREAGRDDGHGRDPADGRASAGQAYVEDGAKLENGERFAFSFGTIGERFEDRVKFWEALEEAEAHPRARVQHRLIVELPHEATREARFEVVRRFCERFEADGVPFWAALHAPGEKNDARNFHAHVVYSERPAKRVPHPDRPGEAVWDFEVVKTWTDSSRHARTSRPLRQDKLRTYTARGFIKTRRSEFAKIVNDVLTQGAVKGRDGKPVLYDPRTYAAMGVDAVPMRSIDRIVADRARDGATTVLDRDYTGRMIAAELREAAARRDKDLLELVALDDTIRAATAPAPKGKDAAEGAKAKPLPRELRGPNLRSVPKALLRAAGDRIMAARHEALRNVVMERATTAALERVIEATAPEALAASVKGAGRAKAKPGVPTALPPDQEAARLLREAALEELAEVRREADKARRTARHRVGTAVQAWRDLVEAPLTTTSAATRRALLGLDDEERGGKDAHGAEHPSARQGPVKAAAVPGQAEGSEVGDTATRERRAEPSATDRAPAPGRSSGGPGDAGRARADGASDLARSRPGAAAEAPRSAAGASTKADDKGKRASWPETEVDRGGGRAAAGGRTAGRKPASGGGRPTGAADPFDATAGILAGQPGLLDIQARMKAMISGIAEASDDPGERLEMVKDRIRVMEALVRGKRESLGTEGKAAAQGQEQGRPIGDSGWAAERPPSPQPSPPSPPSLSWPASSTATPSGPPSAEAGSPKVGTSARGSSDGGSVRPIVPTPAQYEMRLDAPDGTTSAASDARRTAEKAGTSISARPGAPAAMGSSKNTIPTTAPTGGHAVGGEVRAAEDPDDARRRRIHEDEEVKRKKKRKAVLGRRNKERSR